MEREKLVKLYEAIKSDNEKLFTSFMLSKSDLNICFGRFPILSLCYLYKSYKILLKYEKYLMPINKFDVVPEYFQIYKDFKRYAKKSLRLYACSDKIVYPLEMLAVLDDRKLIKQKYKFLFKNEEILQNMQKIYTLNKKIQIIATREKFECEAKKFNLKQKIIAGASAFVFMILSVFSFVMISVMRNSFGIGTEKNPLQISTASELELALKKGYRYYELKNDIVLANGFSVSEFSGTLIGNDKTIVINAEQSDSLIQNLSGKIDNVNFEFELKDKEFTKSFAILAENNTGTIQNCDFSGIINCKVNTEEDVFVSGVVTQNDGVIDKVSVELNSVIDNMGEKNAYLAGIAGKNAGTITNTKTLEAKFEADTVDLAGIAGENHGTISACENNIKLDQISNSKNWNPNCAGISMINYGKIENSVNRAEIKAESTATEKPVQDGQKGEIAVIVGGIVCDNYNEIKDSLNLGNVSAIGDVAMVYVGGIASRNVIEEVYSIVEKSLANCEVVSKSKGNFAYAGGVTAWNSSEIVGSGFEGVIEANTNYDSMEYLNVFAGGVVGYNNNCKVEKSYADVTFRNKPEEVTNIIKMYGGVIGFIGVSSYYNTMISQFVGKGDGFNYVKNNYYVHNETTEYACYGRVYDVFFASSTGFEKVAADGELLIKVENISDIPEEVRIYE